MSEKWNTRMNMLVNVVILVFIAFLLFRPDGLVGSELGKWRKSAETRRAIQDGWAELSGPGHRVGTASGDRVLVEFADYQCPACKQTHLVLDDLARDLNATVVYRHMPLTTIHPNAGGAARAAICAEGQGRFEQMHDRLYATTAWYDDPNWEREARAAGVPDLAAFAACLESEETSRRLLRDRALAQRLGVRATPTFVGPRGSHSGLPDKADLEALLR